jgi:ribokinase
MGVMVFGSINMDLTTYVTHLPAMGETLFGSSFITVPGGKGDNQAVAAARLGAQVKFIGRVGTDAFGPEVLKIVAAEKVDVSGVAIDPRKGTGLAVICVDDKADNAIIVISGANMALDHSDVLRAEATLEGVSVLCLQIEVPLEASLDLAKIARDRSVKVIFDPAPAVPLHAEAYRLMDVITPNEGETEILVGFRPTNAEEAARAAAILRQRGVGTAIIKLGAQGVYYDSPAGKGFLPPFKVTPIDSVAAGDAFNGGLAVALSEGLNIPEAVRWGAAAGALATTRKGAMPSMPYREELLKLLEEQR